MFGWQITASLAAAVSVAHGSVLARSAITDCLTQANVPQALPGSSNYTLESKPFNLRVPYTPAAIALPTTISHVQAAVSCAASNNVLVSAKSGGHSYASYGLGGENGHLVVDLKYMNTVSLDKTTNIATIGGGARLGNVAIALNQQGQRALSHGTCPGVGIGGLTLHGGYGYASRTHGLTLDNLVEATVVLANSTVVTASATNNTDLFWALRGAGSSFGIVTSFKFNTFAAPSSVVVFNYPYSWGSASQAATALDAIQKWANTTQPAELNARLFINSQSASFTGAYYGTQSQFNAAIQPLISQIGSPGFTQVQTMDWMGMLRNFAYMDLQQPVDYDIHETFFSKSMMTPLLPSAAITAFANYWYNTAKGINRDWYIIMDLHGGANSAITKVAPNATAYAHRGALLKFELYDRVNGGSYPSNGFSFLNGLVTAVQNAMGSGQQMGMYINYADTTLTPAQAHQYYYLDHYNTLTQLKSVYDPKKLIMNPHAISST